MNRASVLLIALLLLTAAGAVALESREFRLRDDFGTEPLYDCYMSYYYYIPCPTYSWFWGISGWEYGDVVGIFFTIGDVSTSTGEACDPAQCQSLARIRFLDFNGYGTVWPGIFSVEFDLYCCDEQGCPIGPSLWNSGRLDPAYAWNYVDIEPPICITGCSVDPGSPLSAPRVLLTATHTGFEAYYPMWGLDNISWGVDRGCDFHDYSCMPAVYPRPYNSHYPTMHSGYYGKGLEYCPPVWFKDQQDSTPDATLYGFIELAWRIYLLCSGPTNVEPTTWGNIKSMYR
jgi:hypothetical protein